MNDNQETTSSKNILEIRADAQGDAAKPGYLAVEEAVGAF
jgi:hypothetical protein